VTQVIAAGARQPYLPAIDFGDSPMLELRIMTIACAIVGAAPIIYMLMRSA
jgi:hypothetical protein